jgi:tetratricopeptide (TPR) repeat protein
MSSVFAVQSTIAQQIAGALRAKISPDEQADLDTVPTTVVAAYDDYLKARSLLNRFWIRFQQIEEAIDLLGRATDADPEFAEAWALLSRAETERVKKLRDLDDREAEIAEASEAAEIALETARRLKPGHVATLRAEGYFYQGVKLDMVAALRSLDAALEAVPNDSQTRMFQAMTSLKLQQPDRAVATMEEAFSVDNANWLMIHGLAFMYEVAGRYGELASFLDEMIELEPEMTHFGVKAAYFHFLADGGLESFQAFERALETVEKTDSCDLQELRNAEMVVAMINDRFDAHMEAWAHKWDRHHANHGNWACPAQINDEANHAHLLLERGAVEEAQTIISRAKSSTMRPYTEMSVCIFDRAAFLPKLAFMSGETTAARRDFDKAVVGILKNDTFPRGAVEKSVLLESADMVAPDRVYDIYREISDDPIAKVTMEKVCANPWTYPNLLNDPRFIEEVRRDGRFVEFLQHFGLISAEPEG